MAANDRNGSRNGGTGRRDNGRVPAGGSNGRNGSSPVVPARREQRIERSPSTVVRQAGEVRGRNRITPPPSARDDSWSGLTVDRAMPLGPVADDTADLEAGIIDAEVVEAELTEVTGATPVARVELAAPLAWSALPAPQVPVGDITYDRAPVPLVEPPTVATPLLAPPAPPVTEAVPVVEAPAAEPVAEPQVAPAAAPRPRRSFLRRRHRVRKVSRIVRRVDAWSVLKVSLIFFALAYVVLLIAGVLLWNLAQSTGTVANIEGFIRELFSLKTFKIDGARVYRASWPVGVFLVVAGTGLSVTAAVMFNLITDLVGGVRVTVLEEEVRVVESARSRRRFTRTTLAGPAAAQPAAQPAPQPSANGQQAPAAAEAD